MKHNATVEQSEHACVVAFKAQHSCTHITHTLDTQYTRALVSVELN